MEKEFDYSPTFLGGVSSILNHYYGEFSRAKDMYISCLEELRELSSPKKDEVLVKSWRSDIYNMNDPQSKALFYSGIANYIKENSSDDWVFSRTEEYTTEEYIDAYDDYTTEFHNLDLYVYLKTKDSLINSDVYKDKVKYLESLNEQLELSKQRFLKEASDYYIKENR